MFGHQDDSGQSPQDSVNSGYLFDNAAADSTAAAPSWSAPAVAASQPQPAASSAPLLEATAADGYVATSTPPPSVAQPVAAAAPATTLDGNGLLDIKQQALQQLSPLVNHLDQSPEEKFHTTMMMIQASDNQDLLSTAFETAQQITDDKGRAQALLDIINEINYFTQGKAQA